MLDIRCGMVGNPILAEIEWSEDQMEILKGIGYNMLQLNIAWDNRPKGEVLNLEDLDQEHMNEFKRRIAIAKKYNISVMPHFGLPKMEIIDKYNLSAYMKPSCILEEECITKNVNMLNNLLKECPEINDVMIYTYDQHAWICSEFGTCPNCSGIPLHERLPKFINKIKSEAAKINPNITLWWQPWELSAGQTYKIIKEINTNNFGLMMNTAITESYYNNYEELWLRNIALIAKERDIPIIGEIQTTGSGVGTVPLQSIPCPYLVYRQVNTFRNMDAAVGIKEHFGIAFSKISTNTLFLKEYLNNLELDYNELVDNVAKLYGNECKNYLIEAWQLCDEGIEFIPFDACYLYTNIAGYDPKHEFDTPNIQALHCDTPSWESNRRAYYIMTHETNYHPWVLEDVGLRMNEAAERLYKATEILEKALKLCTYRKEDLQNQYNDLRKMSRAVKGQALYMLESIAAYDIRTALFQKDSNKYNNSVARLDKLLKEDVSNQDEDSNIVEKYREFKQDPKLFIDNNLRQKEKFYIDTYTTRFDQRY